MYGITFDLDLKKLEELEIDHQCAYKAIEDVLKGVGYKNVQDSIYVCSNPKSSEILVIHETVEALKTQAWLQKVVNRVVAFEIESWGDITESIKQPGESKSQGCSSSIENDGYFELSFLEN